MKLRFALLLGALTIVSLSSHVQAQQVQVGEIDVKIEYDTQKTPAFEAGGVKGKDIPNPLDWLEVEVEFEVDARPNDAVIPDLMFRYHIAIESDSGQTQVLTGDVKHVNVVAGEEIFSVAYVSPSTLGKITGDFRRFQPSAVKSVAVEVFYGGVLKGGDSTAGSGRWWEQLPSSQGVLAKHETPFALLWLDRYADVEQTR